MSLYILASTFNRNSCPRIGRWNDKKVMGYKCRKARLKYEGREWIAWYPPPDLPISSGPWKFYGFPGLVLKAEDTTGTHRFEAYSLLEGKGLTINEVSDVGG